MKIPTKTDETIIVQHVCYIAASRLRHDINLNESPGTHEFSAIHRSMFALDGTQLLCANKSKLRKVLENQVTSTDGVRNEITNTLQSLQIRDCNFRSISS